MGGMVDYPSDATTLVLSSMFKHRHPDRRRASFMITKPGQLFSGGGTGTEVNFDGEALLQSALYVQRHGAPHLRGLPVGQVESDLINFVMESYHLLAPETFLRSFSGSYADSISTAAKASFTAAFAKSRFFVEPRLAAVFPLVPITVSENYVSAPFFLSAPGGLAIALGADAASFDIVEDTFPPVSEWSGRREPTGSWLGVRAPSLDSARKVRSVVLGSVALLPHHQERYTFSGRRMFGGHVTLSDRYSLSFGDAHTPALMSDLVIGGADKPWLDELARKLATPSKEDRKHLKALTYFYRAWAPDPVKRFPTLFAAIDAIFGDAGQATQAVVDAVGPVMGTEYTSERIRLMLGLRASVVHGGAPDVYESSKYQTYYRTYGKDAVKDMELIVARCLQQVIFPGKMTERPHNHAEEILRETGRAI
jgi:hypothetical protein